MWVFDEESRRFLAVNDAAIARYGYSRDEFLDMTIDDIRPPEDVPGIRNALKSVPRPPIYRGTWRHTTKSGETFTVDIVGTGVTFDGRSANLVAAVDVTERQITARQLELTNRRLQALFDYALEAMLLVDDHGQCVDVNVSAASLLGYSRKELLQLNIQAITLPDRPATEEAWRGFPKKGVLAGECHLLRRDGTVHEAEFRAIADILPGLHLAVMRDISARKQIEQTIRQQAQILDQVDESIISTDTEMRVTSWNRGAERLFGYAAAEAIGRPIWFLCAPEEYQLVSPSLINTVQRTGRHALDIRLRRKDGRDLLGHMTLSLLRDEVGQVSGLIACTFDVTARSLAETKLRRSHSELRRFAARAQSLREEERRRLSRELHDQLGQALTAMKIDLAWIAERLGDASEVCGEVHEKTASMLRLTDETIQRVRRIATELRPGVLDKLGLVAAIEWQANEFERRSGVRCRVSSGIEHVHLDHGRSTAVFRIFEQALNNVASHAKASSVAVSVAETHERLVVTVSDNGRGISDRALAGADSLGLIGMRERAALLGGTVDIRRRRPTGTTVTMTIPLEERRKRPREFQ
jgi:PAS domain S-box-containing protein